MKRETPRWVLIARILRARGNKGEVAAEILTDFPQRLARLKEVFVGEADGNSEPRPMAVKSCWPSQNHRGQAVFHFEEVNSIAEAEKLRGLEVLLPIVQRVTLPAGRFFVSDLIGCSVFENPVTPPAVCSPPCYSSEAPELLGIVRDVQFAGDQAKGTAVLDVETSTGEILIPLAEDICKKIDTVGQRIDVVLPEGLRDLNRS